jgi:hypothetical protein
MRLISRISWVCIPCASVTGESILLSIRVLVRCLPYCSCTYMPGRGHRDGLRIDAAPTFMFPRAETITGEPPFSKDERNLTSLFSRRYIQATCATSGEGLYEGLDWMSSQLAKKG